ncbi:hypothetical protein V5799_017905 [Amblyomma americanum]|uniref:Uncharacterized protein n=1 Tax=Amblyomma americanum TaxID=6943 RepID=A0AAQ4F1U7_AMBAM
MDYLNLLLGGNASAWTRKLMEFYLSNVASPGNTQNSAPWCRVVDPTFFRGLEALRRNYAPAWKAGPDFLDHCCGFPVHQHVPTIAEATCWLLPTSS